MVKVLVAQRSCVWSGEGVVGRHVRVVEGRRRKEAKSLDAMVAVYCRSTGENQDIVDGLES